jgi:hypothetical protein
MRSLGLRCVEFVVTCCAFELTIMAIAIRPTLLEPRLQAAHLHAERYRLDLRRQVHHHKRQVVPGHNQHLKSLPRGRYVYFPFLSFFCSLCAPSSLIAVSSTHGNAMGARTLFPAFSCSGTSCTITAPPNANISPPGWHQLFILDGPTPSHSTWVRIGGDPAKIGNWPPLSDFTLPGV